MSHALAFDHHSHILACAQGRAQALHALFQHEAPAMLALAESWLADEARARQVVTDTFMLVWRHASHYPAQAQQARAWLYSILRHRLKYETREQGQPDPLRWHSLPELDSRVLSGLAPSDKRVFQAAYCLGLGRQVLAQLSPQGRPEALRRSLAMLVRDHGLAAPALAPANQEALAAYVLGLADDSTRRLAENLLQSQPAAAQHILHWEGVCLAFADALAPAAATQELLSTICRQLQLPAPSLMPLKPSGPDTSAPVTRPPAALHQQAQADAPKPLLRVPSNNEPASPPAATPASTTAPQASAASVSTSPSPAEPPAQMPTPVSAAPAPSPAQAQAIPPEPLPTPAAAPTPPAAPVPPPNTEQAPASAPTTAMRQTPAQAAMPSAATPATSRHPAAPSPGPASSTGSRGYTRPRTEPAWSAPAEQAPHQAADEIAPPVQARAERQQRPALLPWAGGIAFVLAMGFAAYQWLGGLTQAAVPAAPPPVRIQQVAVMQAPGSSSTPGWLLTQSSDMQLSLKPLVGLEVAPSEAIYLWTQAAADPVPRLLARVMPDTPLRLAPEQIGPVQPGQVFEMTLEPIREALPAEPEGPVLFIGRTVGLEEAPATPQGAPVSPSTPAIRNP